MTKEATKQKTLFAVHMFRIVLELFTNTFLTSYIVSVNPNDIFGSGVLNIGLLYISQFATYIIVYLCVSFWVDKSNRVSFLRVGILIYAAFLLVIVFYGQDIARWVMVAGFLCGLSDAFYYSSYLVMRNELNSRSRIKSYNMWTTITTNLIKVVIPTVLGLLIDVSGYSNMSLYILLLVAIQFILSFFIKSHRPQNSGFEIGKYFKYLKDNREARDKIKYNYYNAFLAGVKNTYKIVVVILTIYTFKTNFSLGLLTSAFSLAAMIILLLYKRYDNSKKMNKFVIYLLMGVVPFVACVVMVCWLNVVTLIIYNLSLTITIQFSDYVGTCERDSIIKHLDAYDYIAEHQFTFEMVTCIGRVLSYALFVVVGMLNNIIAFKILLIIFIAANPLKNMVMFKQRKIRKEFEVKYYEEKQAETTECADK